VNEPRSANIVRAEGHVTPARRREVFGHGPATVWFTGLSGSGKSTLAFAVEAALLERGVAAYVLDGDNIRFGLNRDLGFAPEDRTENIRRIGEVCRLMYEGGLGGLTALISPYVADRAGVRQLHPDGGFVEVFVDTPLAVCEARDVKGLYVKARDGSIPEFSGISAPYETPTDPELTLDTSTLELDACVDLVLAELTAAGVIER
jgi:adenylylsulfate kinase